MADKSQARQWSFSRAEPRQSLDGAVSPRQHGHSRQLSPRGVDSHNADERETSVSPPASFSVPLVPPHFVDHSGGSGGDDDDRADKPHRDTLKAYHDVHKHLELVKQSTVRFSRSLFNPHMKKKHVFVYTDRMLICRRIPPMRRYTIEEEIFYKDYSLHVHRPGSEFFLYNGDAALHFRLVESTGLALHSSASLYSSATPSALPPSASSGTSLSSIASSLSSLTSSLSLSLSPSAPTSSPSSPAPTISSPPLSPSQLSSPLASPPSFVSSPSSPTLSLPPSSTSSSSSSSSPSATPSSSSSPSSVSSSSASPSPAFFASSYSENTGDAYLDSYASISFLSPPSSAPAASGSASSYLLDVVTETFEKHLGIHSDAGDDALREAVITIVGIVRQLCELTLDSSKLCATLHSILLRYHQVPSFLDSPLNPETALRQATRRHIVDLVSAPSSSSSSATDAAHDAARPSLSPLTAEHVTAVLQPAATITPAEFFRLYLISTRSPVQPQQSMYWITLLRRYVAAGPPATTTTTPTSTTGSGHEPEQSAAADAHNAKLLTTAQTLIDHLLSHHLDVHNSLIGLPLSPFSEQLLDGSTAGLSSSCLGYLSPQLHSVGDEARRNSAEQQSNFSLAVHRRRASTSTAAVNKSDDDGGDNNNNDSDDVVAPSGGVEVGRRAAELERVDADLDNLVQLIIAWSELPDDRGIATMVRHMAEALRFLNHQQQFRNGSLAIVDDGRRRFARVLERRASTNAPGKYLLRVTLDPSESWAESFVVAENKVQLPNNDFAQWITHASQLLCDPVAELLGALGLLAEQQLRAFFQHTLELDIAVVETLLRHETPSLTCFLELEKITTTLHHLLRDQARLADAIQQLRRKAAELVLEAVESPDFRHVYVPNLSKTTGDLARYFDTFPRLTFMRIVGLKNLSQEALASIESKKDAILSGAQKSAVTEQWLEMIDEAVVCFLQQQGFSPDSIPADYISMPPSDIIVIEAQHHLLRQMLDLADDSFGVKKFVRSLSAEIQRVVASYRADVVAVLSCFIPLPSGVDVRTDDERIDVFRHMLDTVSINTEPLDPKVAVQCRALIDDLQYLSEMTKLEADFFDATQARRLGEPSHVVPVSGLIMAKFHILEQELRTILEIWKPAAVDTAAAAAQSSSTRQSAEGPAVVIAAAAAAAVGKSGGSPSLFRRGFLSKSPTADKSASPSRVRPGARQPKLIAAQRMPPCSASPLSAVGQHHNVSAWLANMQRSDVVHLFEQSPRTLQDYRGQNGESFLHQTVASANFELDESLVASLLSLGLFIDARDNTGATPLMQACRSGSILSIYSLLQAGASPAILDNQGVSAFHVLAGRSLPRDDLDKHSEYFATIFAKFVALCGVDFASQTGDTPLLSALLGGCDQTTITVLLDLGADPNAKNRDGKSPLYVAVEKGLQEVAQQLLQRRSVS